MKWALKFVAWAVGLAIIAAAAGIGLTLFSFFAPIALDPRVWPVVDGCKMDFDKVYQVWFLESRERRVAAICQSNDNFPFFRGESTYVFDP